MKHKIVFLFLFVLCSISNIALAQPVNINTAKAIAKHHLASNTDQTLKSAINPANNFNFTSVIPAVENNDTLYYILNDTINNGFVIVSADQRAWPILAYSTKGSFNEKEQPKAFTHWMDNRKKEIEHIIKNNIQPRSATITSWKNLSLKSSAIETTSVEPLIKTQWDQGCYYNSMCPTDVAGPCGHAYTGCTATAMAQIMKYWNFPTKGNGSHSYSHSTYGVLSADFGSTTYQWSQMTNKVINENNAVATLMYHCGVSLETDYGTSGSSAWDPRDELVKFFNYSSDALVVVRGGISTSDWGDMLKSELDLGHPIYYYGGGNYEPHSFICDGYQGEDYFHFNWGWGGTHDGYYYLGNLNPGWYNFSEDHLAIINIVPGDLPEGYKGFFLSANLLDLAVSGDTISVDVCSSTDWTASSDQSWFTLSTNTGGSGKTTLTLTATENQSEDDRSALITISANGYTDQIITVRQGTVVNVTPNGLYNSISQNAVSIQKLKLKGSIDARDFKTMRDAMPSLTEVDLSEVTIVAYSGTEGPVSNNIWTYPKNTVPENAFLLAECQGEVRLETIILPETTTSIGALAFGGCKYLSAITIPKSVVNIRERAFESCNALINVDANNPNYSGIDGVLFNKAQTELLHCPTAKMGTYTLPSSVTKIVRFAFEDCRNLTSVIIPSSVTTIGSYAFRGCNKLTSIRIPASVTLMDGAFSSTGTLINVDANNPNYSSIDGVLFNKIQTELLNCPTSITGTYTIPSSVTSVGASAFFGCSRLTDITVPTTVHEIGTGAFIGTGLTTITIPESVTAIHPASFYKCTGLTSVSIPSSVISIGRDAFNGCENLLSIYAYAIYPVDLNLSDNVFRLINKELCTLYVPFGSKAAYSEADKWKDFANIVEMSGVFLSNNRIGMGPDASTVPIVISSSSNWNAKSDQEWLTINPSNGTSGRDSIYFTASAISTKDTRAATVTMSSPGIDSQTITVTQYGIVEVSAGNLKTAMAEHLSTVTSLSLTGIIDARDFKTMRDNMPALTNIDLSGVTIAAYSGTEGTRDPFYSNKFYAANEVPESAFFDGTVGKTRLTSVILPNSVISIGPRAFKDCNGLYNMDIPSQTSSIERYAFENCKRLTSITIPSSVTSITNNSFFMCSVLFNVDKNNRNYSSIDGVLFNKKQTKLLQCPASKTGNYTIPSTVTSIGDYSFYYSSLSDVTIPPSVTSIGNNSFDYSNLTEITIPSSVISVGNSAFGSCTESKSLIIPSSVTTIGHWAFGHCRQLYKIYAYATTPVNLSSSPYVFANVNKYNCTLYVPYGSKAAYSEADQWKDFKSIVEMPGIFLSNNQIGLGPNESTITIVISSSSNWNAKSDQEWLTINPSSGITGRDSIYFTASAISTQDTRTATVTISAPGLDPQTVTVKQVGSVEISAGNLKTVMEEHLAGITSLTLTGTIDARDFKTMRDDMPELVTIDLSGVTIAAYFGTEGPATTGYWNYEANSIPQSAFSVGLDGNTCLESIILPDSVTSIGNYAFSYCKALKGITIPATVTSIGDKSFNMSSVLFKVDPDNRNYSSTDSILFNKAQTVLLMCPASKTGDYTIPSTVTTIASRAFQYSNLTTVSIPSSVITIANRSFIRSTLTGVSIPSAVTYVGDHAFYDCGELTAVTIPSSVTTIGQWAFGGCRKLSTIYAYPTTPVDLISSPDVFAYVDKYNSTLYVPSGTKAAYSMADQWKDFANIVELPNQAPFADAGTDRTVDEKSVFSLDGMFSSDPEDGELSYLWTIPTEFTVISNTESQPTFTAPEVSADTTFTFSLVVNDGTVDSPADTIKVTVLNTIKTSIDKITESNKFHIYPNPTSGLLEISKVGLQERNYTIEVYNGIGELKLIEENVSRIDLSSFSNGIYFIKLNTKSQTYLQKIIKK